MTREPRKNNHRTWIDLADCDRFDADHNYVRAHNLTRLTFPWCLGVVIAQHVEVLRAIGVVDSQLDWGKAYLSKAHRSLHLSVAPNLAGNKLNGPTGALTEQSDVDYHRLAGNNSRTTMFRHPCRHRLSDPAGILWS